MKQKKYEIKSIAKLETNNLQYWYTNDRAIVIKEYKTESSFLRWLDDQSVIAEIYNKLSSRIKNNLYFLLIINFKIDNLETKFEINAVQKNRYICKKYVVRELNDLNKIPFLTQDHPKINQFNFDNKFKYNLRKKNERNFNIENHSSNYKSKKLDFVDSTSVLLDYYINKYINNENHIDDLIENILEKEGR